MPCGWESNRRSRSRTGHASQTIFVFSVLLFVRVPFCVRLVCICMCSVLFLLVKLSVLAKWLIIIIQRQLVRRRNMAWVSTRARKSHLRKPNHGEWIISTKPRMKSVYDFLGLLCCFIFPSVLWHCWLGNRKGIWPVKKLDVCLLMVTIWLELCTTYSSSCHHHLHHL